MGTSLPRECGLAAFSQDLMNEIEQIQDFNAPRMIAVNNNKSYAYGNQVMAHSNKKRLP
ncbi:hypothetical protein AB4Z45_06555 [Paenibacillus sp. MCAF9]